MSGPALPLSAPVLAILSPLIEERLGLFFQAEDSELLAEKISPRARELGLDSLLDYYYFLRYDPGAEAELLLLAEALVVNETYFGREADQLNALLDELLPVLLESRPRVRIWSAACSTGEEPLGLCGMLQARGLLGKVEVLASDVSQRVLDRAKLGRFWGRSLRALPLAAERWLKFDGQVAVVSPELLRAVTWRRVNLTDSRAVAALGSFDVILCRNVLIYFRDATIEALARRFEASLTPGGYLLVGASESLLRFGLNFQCEEHRGAFFYRKPTT
jgi:chemotaxis protein methyltransferase CheR